MGIRSIGRIFVTLTDVVAIDTHDVRFTFKTTTNLELPLIIGSGLKILSRQWWQNHDFAKTLSVPPLGSGPYTIDAFETGRYVRYKRNPNYWAKDLAVNKGRYNFDSIQFDYYRDATVAREAFKAEAYDFRLENQAKAWANDYDFPAVNDGRVVVEALPHSMVSGMQGFVMNTRRMLFQDRRVRQALIYAYDFPWANRVLFHDAYTRSHSYFANSELAAQDSYHNRRTSPAERIPRRSA